MAAKTGWRSLQFQIVLLITVLLLIPVLLLLYDIFFASKSDEAMLSSMEERMGSVLLNRMVPGITRITVEKLAGKDFAALDPETRTSIIRTAFDETVSPLVPNFPGVRFGLYIPQTGQVFVHGFLHQFRPESPEQTREREKRILTEADSGLAAVLAGQRPFSRLTTSLNDETFEYLAPVRIKDKMAAIVWMDERLNPIFAQSRYFRLVSRYVALFVFFICAAGTLLLVHSLTGNVKRLKEGLGRLETDLGRRLPELPGEAGQIARAINRMASSLAEKEKLEEELYRNERLASLGRLVAGVAHELRNPLAVIKTTVQVLEGEAGQSAELKESLAVINEQVDRQNRIIQELLDFGRPQKYFCQPLLINQLLQQVLTFTAPMLRQNAIQLTLDPARNLPPVDADGQRLKQVFVNLILNAIQAMPEGGALTIRTGGGDGTVCIFFTDTGSGIDSADLPHIFDPFYTTRDKGTGLGLSISHQIVKEHGGSIEVTGTSPGGTTFCVCLPAQSTAGGMPDEASNHPDH
ncbi:ATP-binding protein [Desulfotomaculum copahuensis]|uniref:histidine kinase n=1 Tax=Desulfotomaculum copahuensis TaxID=1838280 RepID=A0A1B7LHT0_9FIRM|nr:ATP-binding protein [Desulfotomaculum copahuensis]OAT85842.1 two-component sensor histidine kinase [Desulfotomaculum copahuensis]